ncbi:hypothetical protein E2562_027617, partial [Oryza meyeriana var. granulata]
MSSLELDLLGDGCRSLVAWHAIATSPISRRRCPKLLPSSSSSLPLGGKNVKTIEAKRIGHH